MYSSTRTSELLFAYNGIILGGDLWSNYAFFATSDCALLVKIEKKNLCLFSFAFLCVVCCLMLCSICSAMMVPTDDGMVGENMPQ